MVDRNILEQYYDLKQEEIEITDKIGRLQREIRKLDERINEIESGETTIDSVSGGYGGTQHFVIEGIPIPEYKNSRSKMFADRIRLEERLEEQQDVRRDLSIMVVDVERFIRSVKDSHVRRIMRYRFEEHLSWREVADKVGGGNTEGSVKMAYIRYMQSRYTCYGKK